MESSVSELPVLTTERLILRVPQLADLDDWAAMMVDEETTRYIGGVQPRSMVWRAIMCMIGAWHEVGYAMFTARDRHSGEFIGRMGPWSPEGWPGLEVGWAIKRAAWRQGYGAEAAAACMDFAVDTLGWTEVIHTIDPGNEGSKGVARHLGSRFLEPSRLPAPHDHLPIEKWGQSAAEWRARRRSGG